MSYYWLRTYFSPLLRMSFVLVFLLLIHIRCYCISGTASPMPCSITEAHDLTPSVDFYHRSHHGNGLLRLATAISEPLGISGQPQKSAGGCLASNMLVLRLVHLAWLRTGKLQAKMMVGEPIPKSS